MQPPGTTWAAFRHIEYSQELLQLLNQATRVMALHDLDPIIPVAASSRVDLGCLEHAQTGETQVSSRI